MRLLQSTPKFPKLSLPGIVTEDCDDDFQYMGGDHKIDNEKPKTRSEMKKEKDLDLYNKSMYKLKLVSFVSIFFIIAQCIGGYLANSIAIFTDTAHLGSDMVGFMMSMVAMRMSMRPASRELTFGWHRAEIIGTMVSIIFLLTLTIWLVFEATGRVVKPQVVKGTEMAITAVMGLFFNLIQMRILHQGEGGYHMGGGSCSHDHGDGEGHDHDHAHEGGEEHGHSHAPGEKCSGHGHSHGDEKGHSHSHNEPK